MESEVLSSTAQFAIGQTIALVVLLIGIYVGITRQLTRMETNQGNIVKTIGEHREDHKALDTRVQGMSRTVERHATVLKINNMGGG